MKIIDAHFHLFDPPVSRADGQGPAVCRPEADRLLSCWAGLDIVSGVVMGNRSLEPDHHCYPAPMGYCVGLDSHVLLEHLGQDRAVQLVEENLRCPQCVGIKLYPGYNHQYVSDPMYAPFYELARAYRKPVAVHMGQTAGSMGKLKYSHPLTLDEVAADWPDVQFVMCHFGNPFLADAAAVLEKNPNVCADLSGLLEGPVDLDAYFVRQRAYVDQLRGWMEYVEDWDKFLFGTDHPAVDVANYVEFIRRLVPEEHHQAVFFQNADRVYRLGLED